MKKREMGLMGSLNDMNQSCMDSFNTAPIDEVVRRSNLRHIAFIMDGNGRWATGRGLQREAGHRAGAEVFKKIVRYCKKIGIPCCTVYAFSTENIKRPKHEVEVIMSLLIKNIAEAADESDIEFKFIGEPAALGENIGRKSAALEAETAGRPYRLNIAVNYGGRAEIVHAVNRAIEMGKSILTEDDISAELYTHGCPEPDLIVRTGNEIRVSNFLIWQLAYSELYFSEKMWPDFTAEDVDAAIRNFAGRGRRWGNV